MAANLTITGTVRNIKDHGQALQLSIPEDNYYNGENHTEWHTVSLFGKLADRARNLVRNGTVVEIPCHIRYTKKDDKTFTNFNAKDLILHANYGKED